MNTPPDKPAAFTLLTEIGIIHQLATTMLERALPAGMTASQFSVLNHLTRLEGEWSPLRLANAFQVTKGAMTNTLQKLEKQGFIALVPDPADGRAKIVTISKQGILAHRQAIQAITPQMSKLMTRFDEAQFRDALPFLTSLRSYLDAERD